MKLECEKCNRKFKRKPTPYQYNAPAAVTTSVMFNFTLPRRKKIIYAKPHLKIVKKLRRARSTRSIPKVNGSIPNNDLQTLNRPNLKAWNVFFNIAPKGNA